MSGRRRYNQEHDRSRNTHHVPTNDIVVVGGRFYAIWWAQQVLNLKDMRNVEQRESDIFYN